MGDSAGTVVRKFFAAFLQSDVAELVSFFSDDAVYIDGPRGVHRGIDAIRSEFAALAQMVPSTTVDIKFLAMDGRAVLVERTEHFEVGGKPIDHDVVGVFEVNEDGQFTRWRDYYDVTSLMERVAAPADPASQG
jgi:limonene-1,2-epoxide hydrolase